METKSSTWEKALTWLGGISLILGVVKAIFDLTNPIESNWWLPFTLLSGDTNNSPVFEIAWKSLYQTKVILH
jgi:formate-dependent nitrite reductase membrane component NrfD